MEAFDFPQALPPLPPAEHNAWSANAVAGRQALNNAYTHSFQALRQEENDSLRYKLLASNIVDNMVPILEGLEGEVPRQWVEDCANILGPLVYELQVGALAAEGVERDNIVLLEPVTAESTGSRGRPRKEISSEYLREAVAANRDIKLGALASALKIHRHTLRKRLRELGLAKRFDDLHDEDLDTLTREYKSRKPTSGLRYLRGHFRRHGLRIQRERARHSLRRVDALGQALRRRVALRRRRYHVPRPNYLWHGDGHHKLIWWGIVIHGFVDGFCRTITGLRASNNNKAATVLDVFMEAIQRYGTPSRMRGDRGGENTKVAIWMVMHRGPGRASFMWGSCVLRSTRNTRIERLWVEVGTQFARAWRAFFTRLGRLHCLDRKNPSHLWLLHLLFLEEINQDCRDFQDDWNLHPIEGVQTKNQSPADLRFLGQLTEGVYREDPLDGIHPDAINRYYGVHGPRLRRPRNQTGAGNDPEEVEEEDVGAVDVSDEEELENQIGADLQKNIRHEPVKFPATRSPFKDAELQDLFVQQLEALQLQPDVLPEDYGILEEEWEEEDYPEIEVFRPGTQGKELSIILPRQIWYPRAARWAQALDFMSRILHELEEEDVSDADGDSD